LRPPKNPENPVSNSSMTSTPGAHEGSISTSLRELARLEERRVREEEEARARVRQAAEDARHADELRAAEAREAAERRAEETWLTHVRREREEAARLAALEAATVEQARREAARRAAADEDESRHRRDLELAAATRGRRELRLARLVVAQVVLLALGGAAAAWGYAGVLVPREELRSVRAGEALAAGDRTIEALRAQLAARDQAAAEAQRQSAEASDRAATLSAELARVRQELERRQRATPKRPAVPAFDRGAVPGFDSHCDPSSHDPLCAAIGH
jgi:hypothetical protein